MGAECRGVAADITVASDRQKLIAATLEHGGQIDALINNAGNMYRGAITELEESSLQDIFQYQRDRRNATDRTRHPAPCPARGRGDFCRFDPYADGLFRAPPPTPLLKRRCRDSPGYWRQRLGEQKIRVNCLLPGAVFTEINQRAGLMDDETALQRLEGMADLHALGRIGTAEEIAEAMAFLICAEWVTGAMIDIDGGLGLGITSDSAITSQKGDGKQ